MDTKDIAGTFEDGLNAGTDAAAGMTTDALRAALEAPAGAATVSREWWQGWVHALRLEASGRIHGTRSQRSTETDILLETLASL